MTRKMNDEIMRRATHIISKRALPNSNRFIFIYRFKRAGTIKHAMNKWAIEQQEIRFNTEPMKTSSARETFY